MKYFYFFLFCWAATFSVEAQPLCDLNTPICEQAIPIGTPFFSGTLPTEINNGGPIPGCGGGWAYHNTTWFKMEAATPNLVFLITPSNCNNAGGFQAGFFQSCDPNDTPLFIQCSCSIDAVSFEVNGLIPNETYYMMFDGCSGDICDYTVEIVQGAINPIAGFGPIDAPTPSRTEVCEGDVVNFTTNIIGVDATYEWTFPADVIPVNIDCNRASTIWGATSGYAVVTVTDVNDPSLVTSDSVYINASQDQETIIYGSYCYPEEFGYLVTSIDTVLSEGITLFDYTSAQGCDSIVAYIITNNTVDEEALLCPGESIEFYGKTYSAPIDQDSINLGIPSSLGCDSFALVTIHVMDMQADLFASSLDIDCLDTVVYISMNSQFDATTYNWTTPDGNIVSPNTDRSIIVDQAGTYILEFTRDSLVGSQLTSCTATNSIVIGDNTEVPVLTFQITNESCDGINDGSVDVLVSNPSIGPFYYNWLDPSLPDSASIPSIAPGTYVIIVTAANGCSTVETVEIVPSFDLTISSTVSDCDSLNGTATATVAGGSSNMVFEWSNGQTGATITDLAPGGYSVTATDQSTNCKTHRNVMIEYDSSCVSYISGYVFNDDVLLNCAPPLPGLANIMVFLDNGQAAGTDNTGYYEFEVEPGVYTVSVVYPFNFDPVCADPIQLDASVPDVYIDNNFFLKLNPNNDLKLKVVKPNPRPGFSRTIRVCLMNVGATTLSGTLTFVHDEMQVFESSSPMETNYDAATRTITWDFTDIPPGAVWIYYPVMSTPQSVPTGETIDYYFKADPIIGDLTPLNNEWSCSLVTTNAYDPNDKQVMPVGEGPEGFITREDSLLSYLVRFQNTGTDTAYTVVIRDTLDSELDINTLVPGPSSHPYRLNVTKGNILEFFFENIYLPDSTVDLEGSNGFVFFDITFDKAIEEGSEIRNSAAIFFDFNPPVITNEVLNTIKKPVGIYSPIGEELNARIFPNPSTSDGTLLVDLAESGQYEITVLDIWGRTIKTLCPWQSFSAGTHTIPLEMKTISAGIYLVSIRNTDRQVATLKWVKFE